MSNRCPGLTSWTVVRLVPDRLLVIADEDAWTWSLLLKPAADGRTRLVTRMHWAEPAGASATAGGLFFELGDALTIARTLHGLEQRVAGTLPGQPGTRTGDPAPHALLPLSPLAALAWLALLGSLSWGAARLLTTRRGGWLALLGAATALGWCLWTDTDPWAALGAHPTWVVASGVVVGLRLLWTRATPWRRLATGVLPALCAAGIAVVLPALTVWDAATAQGMTAGVPGRVLTIVLSAAAAAATAACFWGATGAATAPAVPALAGLGGAVAVATGSVLAGALPVALLLASVEAPRRLLSESRLSAGRPGDAWSFPAGPGAATAAGPPGGWFREQSAPRSW